MNHASLLIPILLMPLLLFSQEVKDVACLDCHQSGSWIPLSHSPRFHHNNDTDFTLLYKHADLDCSQCHIGATIDEFHNFSSKGTHCVDCHQDIHQNYWGSHCEDCHSPQAWDPSLAYRRHNETLFPLLAAHQSLSCYFCHTRPGTMPPLDCQACHQGEFTLDEPAHADLTPRSDCSICHAPTRWNHILAINHAVFFPIYSGNHRGEWDTCADCHTQANDYAVFTCFGSGCHDEADMNDEHCDGNDCEDRNGKTYPPTGVMSSDCFFCHPKGNE